MELILNWLTEHVVFLTLLVIFFTGFRAYITRKTSYWKIRNIQHVESNILTSIHRQLFTKKIHLSQGVSENYKKYSGPYTGYYEYTVPAIMIKDVEILNRILIKDFDHFVNRRTFEVPEYDKISGNFLTQIKGNEWKNVRSAVSPTFTSKKIKITSRLILDSAKCLAKLLQKKAETGEEVNARDLFTQTATDVIAGSVFGLQSKCLEGNKSFSDRLVKIMDLKLWKFFFWIAFPKLGKLLGLSFVDKKESEFLMTVVDTAVKKRKEENITADDFIQHLIDLTETKDGLHEDVNEDEDAKLNHKVNIKEGK